MLQFSCPELNEELNFLRVTSESAGDVAAGDAADRGSSLDSVPVHTTDSLKVKINKSCLHPAAYAYTSG